VGAALVLPGCPAPPQAPQVTPAAPGVAVLEPAERVAALVEAHNRVRAERGLPRLTVSPSLEDAARRHARDMADRRRMAHRGGDGSSPFRRMSDEGYRFARAGENVAMGQPTVEVVMRDWMHSPGHRRNILGTFTEIGAAEATDRSGTPYWCVTFGTPLER
jgi:uncharacterized protein YkwD